eukprot:15049585-Heterocapsa_arctica.AAC.1
MSFDAKPRALEEIVLKAPRRFPAEWPIGCSPKSPDWKFESSKNGVALLNEHYANIMRGIEKELIGAFDLVDEKEKYTGRASAPAFVKRCVIPQPTNGWPRSSQEGRDLRWLEQRCEIIVAAIIKRIPELMADTLTVWTSETIVEQLAQIQRRLRLLRDSIGLPAASW